MSLESPAGPLRTRLITSTVIGLAALALPGCFDGGESPAEVAEASPTTTTPVADEPSQPGVPAERPAPVSAAADQAPADAQPQPGDDLVASSQALQPAAAGDDASTTADSGTDAGSSAAGSMAWDAVLAKVAPLREQADYLNAYQIVVDHRGDLAAADQAKADDLLDELRRLKQKVRPVRRALDNLDAQTKSERMDAQITLLGGGEVVNTLTRQELREAEGERFLELASILANNKDLESFDLLLATYRESEDPAFQKDLRRPLRILADALPSERWAELVAEVAADESGAERPLAAWIIAWQEANGGLEQTQVDQLVAYVEQEADSGEAERQRWAFQFSDFAGLAKPGALGEYFTNEEFNGTPVRRVDATIAFPDNPFPEGRKEDLSIRWTGDLVIPQAGEWTFYLTSDDGSFLSIDGKQVIDNGGYHGMETGSVKLDLAAGPVPFEIRYFQGGGGYGLEFEWSGPGVDKTTVPADAFIHMPTE